MREIKTYKKKGVKENKKKNYFEWEKRVCIK